MVHGPRHAAPTGARPARDRPECWASVQSAGRPLSEALSAALRDRRLLLVLDNFEQVLAAAPLVAELLAAARG